ncbi:Delta(5) fatty acid desaturase A [Hypsibius exemplaris]|uniref:Delta(5) fatty acid desaturase A n=1 Tax=Hypsibius exemplaris TaxID=2072580 RepID=A0A1W0WSG0_HYPEX|nr:Delta(5) fatty acid desaturase A [Hypsibius exemplaris]
MARGKSAATPAGGVDAQKSTSPDVTPPSSPQPAHHHDGDASSDSETYSPRVDRSHPQLIPLPKAEGVGYPVTAEPLPDLPEYTWQEVARHNTPASCWVYIGTKVYDITPWLDRHPGGRQVLLLAAGRDCTDLFTSYHPFTELPGKMLAKFCVGQVCTTEFPQYQPDTGFYTELRKEVGEFFRENKLDSKDPTPGMVRLAGMMVACAVTFSLMIYSCTQEWSFAVQFLAALAFGMAQALPLFHMMHDASHCAIGHTEGWWAVVGRFTLDWFAGASMNSWHNQHILGHHVYTNVLGIDPDLPMAKTGSFRRVTHHQKWNAGYRLQHIYLLFLYGLSALKFRIEDVTDLLIFKKVGPIRMNDIDNREVLSQVLSKTFWLLWRFILPVFYFGVGAGRLLVLSLVVEFVTGYFLNFNFQISHISPLCEFTDGEQPAVPKEWAQSQLATTLDYAHDSPIVRFFNGALNFQSVHHLFPAVSQYHYPALAPIVKRVAAKHGVRFNYVGTLGEAFRLHLQHLYVLGVDHVLHSH